MQAVQNLAKAAPKIASSAVQQVRNNHSGYHVVAKPRNRISFAEKVGTGIFMTVTALFTPVLISTNFNKWRETKE